METIKINNQTFELIPMGIAQSEKRRTFTIVSGLPFTDIETAFSDVSSIQHYSESGELLVSYMDGISVKTISKDLEAGTYIIDIGIDAVEAELKQLRAQVAALTVTE
ncbi:MAG: hypothetical protein K0R34_2459 [Herbinix sp.]|jgi:hypothetical protein|nr:hypothetical protein [Herbinix sp.]